MNKEKKKRINIESSKYIGHFDVSTEHTFVFTGYMRSRVSSVFFTVLILIGKAAYSHHI